MKTYHCKTPCPEPATTILLKGCPNCGYTTEDYYCTWHYNQTRITIRCPCHTPLEQYLWHKGQTTWL
jgi:hypothetical protein